MKRNNFFMLLICLISLTLILFACSDDSSDDNNADGDTEGSENSDNTEADNEKTDTDKETEKIDYAAVGPYPVANTHFEITDASRTRTLTVEVWYPAVESARADMEKGQPVEDFMADANKKATYKEQLDKAPKGCSTETAYSALDADANADSAPWPLVMFSHCMNCVRFSTFSTAERLASHGFAVAAPGHTGGTVFDSLAGSSAALSEEFLITRAADIKFVIDTLLDKDTTDIPEQIRGKFNADKIGMYGHSFGAATTGLVLSTDSRVKAGFNQAAPLDMQVSSQVDLTKLTQPVFMLIAKLDKMVGEIVNEMIRMDFEKMNSPAWIAEVAETGHMSFSNICMITETHYDCGIKTACSKADANGDDFGYMDIEDGIDLGRRYVTSFFAATLLGDEDAKAYISKGHPADKMEVKTKNQ